MKRYRDFVGAIDVRALLAELGILEDAVERPNKRGETEIVGHCPDPWGLHKHGDQTGKFALNADKKVWHCFVCGGGSLLSLTMAVRNMEAEEATDWLRAFSSDATKTDDQWMSEIDRLLGGLHEEQTVDVLPFFNAHVLDKWDVHAEGLRLWNEGKLDGKARNLDWEILLDNARFVPDATKYAPRDRNGIAIDEPYVGPCVIFPHFVGERLVGWQSRWLSDLRPKWVAKYTNTPDFPKSHTLWRPVLPNGQREHLPVVVVESVPTAIYIASIGWPVVATFGASMTPDQLKLLRRFQQGVIFAPDCDKPGVEGLVKGSDYLEGFIPVSYVEPEGHVGDDLLDRADYQDVDCLLRDAIRLS